MRLASLFFLSLVVAAFDRAAAQSFVNVSSASGTPDLAAGSLVSAFGNNLSAQTAPGTPPYPSTLGGIALQVVDSAGAVRLAALLFVSPTQINYMLPSQTAPGAATVNIVNGSGNVPAAAIQIEPVAPELFTANGNGQGVVAATAYRTQIPTSLAVPVPVFQCPAGAGTCVSVPIDPGLDQPVTVTLLATGLRAVNGNPAAVTLTIAGGQFPVRDVLSEDEQGPFPGLDQVVFGLPLSLRGAGEVDISIAVNGQMSNTGRIAIQ